VRGEGEQAGQAEQALPAQTTPGPLQPSGSGLVGSFVRGEGEPTPFPGPLQPSGSGLVGSFVREEVAGAKPSGLGPLQPSGSGLGGSFVREPTPSSLGVGGVPPPTTGTKRKTFATDTATSGKFRRTDSTVGLTSAEFPGATVQRCEQGCLLEALVSGCGIKLEKLGLDGFDDDTGAIQTLIKACRAAPRGTIAHSLKFKRVAADWLPMFALRTAVLITLHKVVCQADTYHWCCIDASNMAVFLGPTDDDQLFRSLPGVVRLQPADLLRGEEWLARYMREEYGVGPPIRGYMLS
jgi:hypothetical protein